MTPTRSAHDTYVRASDPDQRAWSSFENLFRTSPVPLMEQDYSELVEWMEDLRRSGVTNIREYVGDDLETIRSIVPKIRIVAANPAAIEAVGLPLEEIIGPIDPAIVNDGAKASWLSQFEAVWEGRPTAQAAFQAATASGHIYDAESTLSAPLIDGKPNFARAVFTLLDVTDHREEERRILELMEAKNSFLASVSHEIRTPLTALLGFARLLADGHPLTDDDRRLMTTSIVQQAQEMADLVEDLLVAARVELGQIEVVNVAMDVVDQIRQTLDAGGSYAVGVDVECRTEARWASGDPSRVRQILRNLLTNAERYGGPKVAVAVSAADGDLYLDVIDNGPGLPVGEWDRVFEPYHRAHESPGQPGSVGIGLAISRQLAELMGGGLEYHHRAGCSVFRLRLRAATRRT